MNLWQSVRVALTSLGSNKLRTFLTMLGIIIGVAAVIALLAIGNGATANITANLTRNGTNLVTVSPGGGQTGGVAGAAGSLQTLTYEDAQELASLGTAIGIAGVSPERNGNAQVAYSSANSSSRIVGAVPDYLFVHDATIAQGSFISADDQANIAAVAVLGSNVATTLFRGADPIGATIKISGQPYQVIGVMASKGGSGFGSVDDNVFVPLSTSLRRLFGFRTAGVAGQPVSSIAIKATDAKAVPGLIDQTTTLLRTRHKLGTKSNDFTVTNQADQLESLSSVTQTLSLFLGAVAGISLLVGGIGVMNIMLVSVTERTREIGIRKAIGARRSDVLRQFLIEAVVMSILGGLIGVGVGVGAARGVTASGFTTAIVSPPSIFIAFGCAVVVGIFFGIYPANRASRLNPIDALRFD
ncbi:MAG: ABC transporter permease [Thermomicrobiales bacterium]